MRIWKTTTLFFLFLFVVTLVFADDSSTSTIFVIPVDWTYIANFSTTSFSDPGNNTVNITLWLKDQITLELNLTNTAVINGTMTHPDSGVYNINFTNTGANGIYTLTYDYNESGTFTMALTYFNASYATVQQNQTVSVSISSFNLTLTTDRSSYAKGEIASATLNATDRDGNPQAGGIVKMKIEDSDESIWLDWTSMTDLGDGIYYDSFGAPSVVGTYTITANFTKLGTSNLTSVTFTVTVADTSAPGPGGADYYQEGPDGEIRYDIIPSELNLILVTGEIVERGIIIKNLALDSLVVEILTDLETIPSYKTMGIAPNDQLEIKFKIGGGPIGVYERTVLFKFSNRAGNELEDKLPITYTIIDTKGDGEYCVRDNECRSNTCRGNRCEARTVIVEDFIIDATKGNPVIILVIALVLFIALMSILLVEYTKEKREKQKKSMFGEPIKKDYFIIFGKEINKRVAFASIAAVVLVIVFVPIILMQKPDTPPMEIKATYPQVNDINYSTPLRYDITPRGIAKLFLVGEIYRDSFTIKNLDTVPINAIFDTHLSITPKTIVIPPGESREINYLLSGPEGDYLTEIKISLVSSLHNVEDKVLIGYKIVIGKQLGEVCQVNAQCYSKYCIDSKCSSKLKTPEEIKEAGSWGKEHPEFFFIMIAVSLIAILFIVLTQNSIMPDFIKRLITVVIIIIVLLVGFSLFISYQQPVEEEKEEVSFIELASISGKQIQYEIIPASIPKEIIAGLRWEAEITIRNLERSSIVINLETDLYAIPRNFLVAPESEKIITLWLQGPVGEYKKEVKVTASLLGTKEINSVELAYNIVKGEPPQTKMSLWGWIITNRIAVIFIIGMIIFILLVIVLANITAERKK